ncbi:hypothetical protein B9T11_03455 [Wohlfahrtiimonas chitiniclastica]|uniref:DoxX family protein n=1 Tax=Wohlfahrtiimonas chitiniclastica TaxID=400946 RepID=UPI000B98C284|nr:DoxX family protein [Wohlfahrtiimonas chitiniclastica]OYQ70642.1 hypothetical protein B9T13_05105 [Wohlfahrtiimonas chitiniclastica]OYQ82075.1 hypothetical protein B9T11_03455 [Wohlfahrtiimonas chitiniclastica]OYQ83847.1 hypothetical protein B9T14_06400 [Wohlfahrtiimonas chitiniclastica]OYQ84686.1 hypothetical protein B9T15_06430 [Wohlfahrtiimonas chitiniclastica]
MNPNRLLEQFTTKPALQAAILLIARALLAYLFIVAGWAKIGGYAGTAAFMASKGIPEFMLSLVIALELGGGLAILIGFQTRIIALIIAIFCVMSAIIFHGTPEDATSFMKNLSIAGGFLALIPQGAGLWSLDHWLEK